MRFSQRKGIKPVKRVIQIDSMDDELRTSLWNALYVFYWAQEDESYKLPPLIFYPSYNLWRLCINLWGNYFKKPIDTLPKVWGKAYEEIRNYFFNCEWYEVYDFIEFIADFFPNTEVNNRFMNFCNTILEQELSAYRFVGGKIVGITSKEEILEIEKALDIPEPLKGVRIHLERALGLLADKKSPDYRNSIKESISAVEAICKLISRDEKATLDQALNKLETDFNLYLHPALKKAFRSLYGYTSDEKGIRHSLLDEPNINFEDARFMLVVCSAFINYFKEKASKIGIFKNQ
jgi:hypothetical protein